jgi:hypothetical protein
MFQSGTRFSATILLNDGSAWQSFILSSVTTISPGTSKVLLASNRGGLAFDTVTSVISDGVPSLLAPDASERVLTSGMKDIGVLIMIRVPVYRVEWT